VRSLRLPVPFPALPERLDRFLVANVPDLSRRQVKGLIDAKQVRVEGRIERKAGRKLKPGEVVELSYRPSWTKATEALPTLAIIAVGDGWIVVDKPSGVTSHPSSTDDRLSVPSLLERTSTPQGERITAVHRLDRGTSGLLLLAAQSHRAELSALFEQRLVEKQYLAVVRPGPPGKEGELQGPDIDNKETNLRWELSRRSKDGSRAELLITPREGRTHQVRLQLSAAGYPLVGDVEHGTPVPGGAPRLALHATKLTCDVFDVQCSPPEDWDKLLDPPGPLEVERAVVHGNRTPAKTERKKHEARDTTALQKGIRTLRVSRSSARILRGGHPWLLHDRWTGDLDNFAPGDPAYLVDEREHYVATAIMDPGQEVCARVVSTDPGLAPDIDLFRSRGQLAATARKELLDDTGSNAIRIVHGEADGLPGLSIDLWGDVLVSTLSSPSLRTMAAAAYEGVREQLGTLPLFERDHFVDLRAREQTGAKLPGRWIRQPAGAMTSSFWVQEAGHRYFVQPLEGLSSGLYSDQRSNRAILKQIISSHPTGEVANLFAHTGAFSVACAAAGAARVWSVDLSRTYSEIATKNLLKNDLSVQQHPVVVDDAAAWLTSKEPGFSGVILDPPSRAHGRKGGDKGWSSRRDYRRLVALCANRLHAGGWIFCCSNLRGVPNGWLSKQISAGLRDAGRKSIRTKKMRPSPDYPTLSGFPDGTPFQAKLVYLDG
jgi:23S rRNA (cytosine1962-C5)-methyltransferase